MIFIRKFINRFLHPDKKNDYGDGLYPPDNFNGVWEVYWPNGKIKNRGNVINGEEEVLQMVSKKMKNNNIIKFYNRARFGFPFLGSIFIISSLLGFFGLGKTFSNGIPVDGINRTLILVLYFVIGAVFIVLRFTIMKNKL
ncbi:MAG: hypothetical protein GY714_31955 [Desulfobacterales bacterium]|nr:hypothetical protein [Desulfobacterales bacterium]